MMVVVGAGLETCHMIKERLILTNLSEEFLWGGGLSLGWGPIFGKAKSKFTVCLIRAILMEGSHTATLSAKKEILNNGFWFEYKGICSKLSCPFIKNNLLLTVDSEKHTAKFQRNSSYDSLHFHFLCIQLLQTISTPAKSSTLPDVFQTFLECYSTKSNPYCWVRFVTIQVCFWTL